MNSHHLTKPSNNNVVLDALFTQSQSFIELSRSAFNHNVTYYKNSIGYSNKLGAVIKGNGYGHGLIEMGVLCQQNNNVDYLCVMNSAEALSLRAAGIIKPIIVLSYSNSPIDALIKTPTIFMVDTIEYAEMLNRLGSFYNQKIVVHIKVDTGLSRLGIQPSELYSFIQKLSSMEFIYIDGIFSHFIASDTHKILTEQQLHILYDALQLLPSRIPTVHCSNTMAIGQLTYPSLFNLFRVGLGLYGFSDNNALLRPILEWKTSIISTKTVPANSYVSYGCMYQTKKETRLGLLPVGYADGYQFRFMHNSYVQIGNSFAPVLGRVGMNMIIVDITSCNATIGDSVTLIGKQKPLQAIDLAQKNSILNIRELFTGLKNCIPRTIVE